MNKKLIREMTERLYNIESEVHEIHMALIEEEAAIDEMPVDQRTHREDVLHRLVWARERLAMEHETFHHLVMEIADKKKEATS